MRKEWKNFIENLEKSEKLKKRINKFSKIFGTIKVFKED